MIQRRATKHQFSVVGVGRFELPASCSQSRRATELRHTPVQRWYISLLAKEREKRFQLLDALRTGYDARHAGTL